MSSGIATLLPVWPGRGSVAARRRARAGGFLGSLSGRHAERAWEAAREEGYRAWLKAGRPDMGTPEAGALDLVFIGALAAHVAGCERCDRVAQADGSAMVGVTDDRPAEWLRWAVWQVPALRDVARAVGLPKRAFAPWATVVGRVSNELEAREWAQSHAGMVDAVDQARNRRMARRDDVRREARRLRAGASTTG